MIDPTRLAAVLMKWHHRHEVIRIWLTATDVINLKYACHRHAVNTGSPDRFCGFPITLCNTTTSRVVFKDGTGVAWSALTEW